MYSRPPIFSPCRPLGHPSVFARFSAAYGLSSRRGAALVFVLSALALIAFLVLMILTFIRSEDRGTRTAADLIEVRTLAQLPEKLVIAQIRDATRGLGNTQTWASQPGMIRRYNDVPDGDSPRTSPVSYFKLYSATTLKLGSFTVDAFKTEQETEAQAFQQWASLPAAFTDLNQPVLVSPKRKQNGTDSTEKPTAIYPILDPGAHDVLHIDGFEVSNTYSTPESPLPMPAQWLYILRDGSVTAPSSTSSTKATLNNPSPTLDNPIVGRIAYWTDDDSCKLNLNTATEPAPWSPPHTHTRTDEAHAKSQPIQGEHYRDPSHPAFTSLAPVLRHFGTAHVSSDTEPDREAASLENQGAASEWWRHLRETHTRLPRTFVDSTSVGSEGGTRDTSTSGSVTNDVLTKRQALFTTVEEFFFDPERQLNGSRPSGATPPPFDQDDIRFSNFFLTTHSRAPELDLFNRPKLSLWPVQTTDSERNSEDKSLVALATQNDHEYFFQRSSLWNGGSSGSSQSSSEDLALTRNTELIGTLQAFTEREIPGFGYSFISKYGQASTNQILTSVFDFIRSNANVASPQSPTTQKPRGSDYNFLAPGLEIAGNTSGLAEYSAVPINGGVQLPGPETPPGSGQFATTQGLGRFPTIAEVAIVFAATEADATAGQPADNNGDGLADKTKRLRAFIIIRPYLVSPGSPATSPAVFYRVTGLDLFKVAGKDLWPQTPKPLVLRNRAAFSASALMPSGAIWSGHSSALPSFCTPFLTDTGTPKAMPPLGSPPDVDKDYAFVSDEIELPPASGSGPVQFQFTGGEISIDIMPGANGTPNNSDVIQTLYLTFPDTTIPSPLMELPQFKFEDRNNSQAASQVAGNPPILPLIRRGDVVRSVESHGSNRVVKGPGSASTTYPSITLGDMRLLAATHATPPAASAATSPPPPTFFAPHLEYHTLPAATGPITSVGYEAHNLRDGNSTTVQIGAPPPSVAATAMTAQRAGGLVARTSSMGKLDGAQFLDYTKGKTLGDSAPGTPADMPAAFNLDNRPGDFDNGPGLIEDGPYINKPDFGNVQTSAQYFDRGSKFAAENGLSYNPARGISSGIAFGSLPSGVFGYSGKLADPRPRPWQTLLFCPNPPSRSTAPDAEPGYTIPPSGNTTDKVDHFGFANPRDHLWAELFWLPKTDPPGLCEGFATEGKVNMNYQMLPYTWITRSTAMHGALHGVRIKAIPSASAQAVGTPQHYKSKAASELQFEYSVNAVATLQAFQDRFNSGDIFRTPSEICDMWLVPQRLPTSGGHTYTSGSISPKDPEELKYKDMLRWWEGDSDNDPKDGFEATGDNLREEPYAQLYPRLTTRSNVFTVHYRVQLLKKSRSTDPAEWDEDKDNVAAEYRGSTVIERYLDPTDNDAPDFGSSINGRALDDYYRWRVVRRTQFAP